MQKRYTIQIRGTDRLSPSHHARWNANFIQWRWHRLPKLLFKIEISLNWSKKIKFTPRKPLIRRFRQIKLRPKTKGRPISWERQPLASTRRRNAPNSRSKRTKEGARQTFRHRDWPKQDKSLDVHGRNLPEDAPT